MLRSLFCSFELCLFLWLQTMERILHEGDCQCVLIYSNILCTWKHFHCGLSKTTEITLSATAVLCCDFTSELLCQLELKLVLVLCSSWHLSEVKN